MNPSPPGDENLRIVREETPRPRLLQDALSKGEPEPLPPSNLDDADSGFTGTGRLTFIGSLILVTIAFSVGFSYLLQHKWNGRTAARTNSASGTASLTAANEAVTTNPAIQLHQDMFNVTAIAMDQVPLAIVNGKRVAEGETLSVGTPEGPIAVRVARIEEGLVRFAYGHQRLEIKLSNNVAQKSPP